MLPQSVAGFRNPQFLKYGTRRQRAAYQVLHQLRIWEVLKEFNIRLAGTIPIDVDIEGSDLDLICEASSPHLLISLLKRHYHGYMGYSMNLTPDKVIVCRFQFDGWPIEIYGAAVKVERQRAWVHMIAEWDLLRKRGPMAHAEIRRMKRQGMKTEPAFARLFGLKGDPYQALYRMGSHILNSE